MNDQELTRHMEDHHHASARKGAADTDTESLESCPICQENATWWSTLSEAMRSHEPWSDGDEFLAGVRQRISDHSANALRYPAAQELRLRRFRAWWIPSLAGLAAVLALVVVSRLLLRAHTETARSQSAPARRMTNDSTSSPEKPQAPTILPWASDLPDEQSRR